MLKKKKKRQGCSFKSTWQQLKTYWRKTTNIKKDFAKGLKVLRLKFIFLRPIDII